MSNQKDTLTKLVDSTKRIVDAIENQSDNHARKMGGEADKIVFAIDGLQSEESIPNRFEKFLRHNRQTVTLISVLLTILGLGWTIYYGSAEWKKDALRTSKEEIKAEKAADLAAKKMLEEEIEKAREEAREDAKQQYRDEIADLQRALTSIETSNNVIRTIEVISRFSENLSSEQLNQSEPSAEAGNANAPEVMTLNLPAFQSLKSLSTALLEASVKDPKETNVELQKFMNSGRHICRILFAKCQHNDSTVSSAALAAAGHVLNTCKMDKISTAKTENGEIPDAEFVQEKSTAFRGGNFSNVNFATIHPNLLGFELNDCKFLNSKFPNEVNFQSTMLPGTDFTGARFRNANFILVNRSTLQRDEAPVKELGKNEERGTIFDACEFRECVKFNQALLKHSSFNGAKFVNSHFSGKSTEKRINLFKSKLLNLIVTEDLRWENVYMPHAMISLNAEEAFKGTLTLKSSNLAKGNLTLNKSDTNSDFNPKVLIDQGTDLTGATITSNTDVQLIMKGCSASDLQLQSAQLLAPSFTDTKLVRAVFGKEAIRFSDEAVPQFTETDLSGANFGDCPKLESDWFDESVNLTMTRIPHASNLGEKLVSNSRKVKLDGAHATVIFVKRVADASTENPAEWRLVKYISGIGTSTWTDSTNVQNFLKLFIKFLNANPKQFEKMGFEPFRWTTNQDGTKKEQKVQFKAGDDTQLKSYLEKLTQEDMQLILLKSKKWKLTTEPEPSAK